MSNKIILHENVVSDDFLEGTTLHYFTFATPWTDKEHILKFGTTDEAIEWYKNNLHDRVIDQGKQWLHEEDNDHDMTDEDGENEWDCIIACCMVENDF